MAKLRTEARQDSSRGHFSCGLCGESYERGHADVFLVGGDGPPNEWRTVCPTCVETGPAGAAERIRKRAADLPRRERRELGALADDVERIKPDDWATAKDLNRAAWEYEGRYRDVVLEKREPVRAGWMARKIRLIGE